MFFLGLFVLGVLWFSLVFWQENRDSLVFCGVFLGVCAKMWLNPHFPKKSLVLEPKTPGKHKQHGKEGQGLARRGTEFYFFFSTPSETQRLRRRSVNG